jgi:hypothetical protein
MANLRSYRASSSLLQFRGERRGRPSARQVNSRRAYSHVGGFREDARAMGRVLVVSQFEEIFVSLYR